MPTTPTIDLSTFDVRTVIDGQLDGVRHRLREQATDLVTRASGDLTGADADTFNQLETALANLDSRARQIAHDKAMAGSGLLGVIADVTGGVDNTPPTPPARSDVRRTGAIPRVAFTEDQLRQLHEGMMSRNAVGIVAEEVPTVDAYTTRAVTGVPMAAVPYQALPPVPFGREPTRITALMPTQNVDHPSVTYYTASAGADAATTVAEGAPKPESSPGWAAVTVPVRKLAHYADVSSEALADFGNFNAVVQAEMVAGLVNVENQQVLAGNGTGTNLLGLLNASGIQTYAPGAAEPRLRSLLHAITLLRTGSAFTEAGVLVVHPLDWEKVQATPATTGELLVSPNPVAGTAHTLWGVPVVVTAQITAGTALVANLDTGTVAFSRQPASLMIDPYSQSRNNLVRFICEERLAVGVTRPAALCAVAFNGAA